MSAPVRFLTVVVIGWTAVRVITLGEYPGFIASYAKPASAATVPPVVATDFPPLPPIEADLLEPWTAQQQAAGYRPDYVQRRPPPYYATYPYSYPGPASAPAPIPARARWALAPTAGDPNFYWANPTGELGPPARSVPAALPTVPSGPALRPAA